MKMNKIILSILLSLSFSPLYAQSDELSALLKKADDNNLSLQAARQDIAAAGYEISAANTLEATSIEYSPFFRKGASGVASSELVVSQEFDFPTLYAARGKAGKMQREALEKGYATTRRDLLLSVNRTYLDIVGLRRSRKILEERAMIADSLLSLFEKRLDNGYATALDVNRIKMEQMDLKSELLQNETDVRNAVEKLKSLCGDVSGPFEVKAADYPYPITSESPESIISAFMENATEIKAARAALLASGEEVKVARQGWIPKLTAGYRRNTELDEASNGFIVGASIPLFSTGKQVKAAAARRAAAQLNLEDAEMTAQTEAKNSLNEFLQLRESLKLTDMNLINGTLRLLRKSVEAGNMSATDYYIESDKIYQKISSYLSIENRLHQSMATLRKNTL